MKVSHFEYMLHNGEGVSFRMGKESLLKVLKFNGMIHRESTCHQFHSLGFGGDRANSLFRGDREQIFTHGGRTEDETPQYTTVEIVGQVIFPLTKK